MVFYIFASFFSYLIKRTAALLHLWFCFFEVDKQNLLSYG